MELPRTLHQGSHASAFPFPCPTIGVASDKPNIANTNGSPD
jgi:hypothetical protein